MKYTVNHIYNDYNTLGRKCYINISYCVWLLMIV